MSICEACAVFSPSAYLGDYNEERTKSCDICGVKFRKSKESENQV